LEVTSETKKNDLLLTEIEKRIVHYDPHVDLAPLSRAYHFSALAHEGQIRQSGEPFLHHPMEVALILTQLKLPLPSIIAGLLHDVLEDTSVTRDQIFAEFGEDVTTLVEGVTKIGKIEFRSMEEKQAENFRKMIVSVAQDFRILLIKLADRLHNMRTLQALSEDKQKRIAQETMEIYAPLANRLGIGWMKAELEDYAFRYLKPDIYENLTKKSAVGRKERDDYIRSVINEIKKALEENNLAGKVYGRTKNIVGVYQKMVRRNIPFEEVYDLMGIRIITDTRTNCYAILGLIHSLWAPVPDRFRDFIALPKSNLYQSLHTTVAAIDGQHVEIQIRTDEMHRVAEEGIAAHWVYKEGGRFSHKDEKAFAWLRQLIEWQQEIVDTRQFMDSVKTDLFSDLVYVFTPKGDVKELMRGATPIDFAYAIHTAVGNHCVGAKVDGKIVPLGHTLKNGDRIEILTLESHLPSRSWLKLAKTPKAKTKIKYFIRIQERERSLEIGKELLERELKRERLIPKEVFKSDPIQKIIESLGLHTLEELFIGIGYGKFSAATVIRPLLPEPLIKEGASKGTPSKEAEKGGLKIKGLGDVMMHISKCCNPVPGEPIIGFITRGRGISVHSVHCPNKDNFDYDHDRLVELTWESGAGTSHSVEILVHTIDQAGVLAAVTTVISQANANISRAEVITTEEKKATLQFCIIIRNASHLEQVLNNIEKVEGVLKARRVRKRLVPGEDG
jgi:GTP pyrophosphokinase